MSEAMSQTIIPVVDIFAGPGGLGEGFSASSAKNTKFDVVLSVEKEISAFRTLLLRTFFRQFEREQVPDKYYSYLRGEIPIGELVDAFPKQAEAATDRCLKLEMGPHTAGKVYSRIRGALKGRKNWVLIGGPPCQAYSIMGRSRLANKNREDFEQDKRHTLYREYLRILCRFYPPVFVMENVRGLLSATFSGTRIFEKIITDLSSPALALKNPASTKPIDTPEYSICSFVHGIDGDEAIDPQDFVIEAEKFGIPQRRHRVILLGIRRDLVKPHGIRLRPSEAPNVRDMISALPKLRSQLSDKSDLNCPNVWREQILKGLAQLSPQSFDSAVWNHMQTAAQTLHNSIEVGGRSVFCGTNLVPNGLARWIHDPKMDFICNHETRRHILEDLLRYLFVSCYAKEWGISPRLHQFPRGLLPDHRNVESAIKSRHGNFSDRFRVQMEWGPATTVTSHIAKDGHYFIHHDSSQCRSWTVREAARIQTFPDNYFFEGNRTDQYWQVGNAVPPYLAVQVAEIVARLLAAQL
jgi:DNA (cytosine-5)-methyltransferase 1